MNKKSTLRSVANNYLTHPKKENGITLIALVITIIILLILAGAAVSIGLNGGDVFNRANQAKTEWNAKVAEEDAKIKEIWGMIDSKDEVKQVNDANPGTLEGSGTEANPYTINSIEDLVAFAYNVNKGDTEYGLYSGKTVALGLDLDIQNDKSYANPNTKYVLDDYGYKTDESGTAIKTLLTDTNGIGFVPIGNTSYNDKDYGFAGIFDGKNHTIINLYENSSTFGGLFGSTSNSVTISNIGIKSCNIIGTNPAGGILGNMDSTSSTTTITITNCYTTGNLESSNTLAGGIIGNVGNGSNGSAIITNCYNSATITSNYPTGGMIGYANTATITNCYNTGNVTSTNNQAGGMLGCAGSIVTIINCYNTGNMQGKVPTGGMLGYAPSTSTITNCYNTGSVTSTDYHAGGMIGQAESAATIMNCYNTGDISSTNLQAGGIIGIGNSSNYASVSYCYNTGTITGTSPVGGIAGANASTTNCHNTGAVTGTDTSLTGEIVGYGTLGTGCTYGTGVAAGTMEMSNFVTRMNEYVTTNNSNPSNTPLKTWKLENGYPVFVN